MMQTDLTEYIKPMNKTNEKGGFILMRKLLHVLVAAAIGTTLMTAGTALTAAASEKAACILGVGGLGDQGYNDLVFAGMTQAKEELGIDFDYAEPAQISDFEMIMRDMCDSGSYSVIVCVGFDQLDALTKVSPDYPDQWFAFIDGVVEEPNVANYNCKEHEGSFLVGALAALMKQNASSYGLSDNHKYGFVGAMDNNLINSFAAGYKAGAGIIDPDAEVEIQYVGGDNPFSDTTTAKEVAMGEFNKGCDIIFHAAGGSGLGVFAAAKEGDFIAIGCNSNQNVLDPDHIAASMQKKVDTAAYEIVRQASEGTLPVGKTTTLGIAEDGVGYTVEGTGIDIPDEIIEKVEELKEKIASGEITVPEELE